MKVGLHVAISGQLALQNRLDSIANNIANIRTAGFRAEGSKFEALVSPQDPTPVAFVSTGHTYISRKAGALVKTGNPLDVAVQGDAWLALQGPNGTVYTRDGRMRMLPTGELQSLNGYPVLDVGGAPITLNAKNGPPVIARDGMITQKGRQVGAIGLFRIDENAKLTRFDNSAVIPDQEPEPVIEFTNTGLLQGFVEQSNVNAALEMTRLIAVTRSFEALNAALNESERTSTEAIKTLSGAGS